jgi:hypothetical protein
MMDERLEAIIDALEYRVAQVEDRLFKEANDTHKRALRRRRQLYYAALGQTEPAGADA